jgi:nitrilase
MNSAPENATVPAHSDHLVTVAAVQMVSTPDVAENLAIAAALIAEAAAAGARLVALPEYFCLMGPGDDAKLAIAEDAGTGPMQQRLAAIAREHGIWLVAGTIPVWAPGRRDKVLNRSIAYGPDGAEIGHYDKLHLFAFDNGRGERYDEGRTLVPGREPVALDLAGLRVGLSICYDLRFPELYRRLMQPAPCDLLLVPAAFTHTTGQAHWELLLRARAVENQCYVLAPAQGGKHQNGRRTWGHSLLADPWGQVVAVREEDGPGVVLGQVDRARLAEVRVQLPALGHRRM